MGRFYFKYVLGLAAGTLFLSMYIFGYKMAEGWESEVITLDGSSVEADSQNEMIVKKNTSYILETYYSDTNETVTESLSAPVEIIGLSRDELIDFIEENQTYFKTEGTNVLNVMLLSFSDSEVVIRRSVEEAEEETKNYSYNFDSPKYYVVLEENGVVVYKEDKSTVYMETGITQSDLDEAAVDELKYGVSIKNISELYRYLESITS